MRSAAADARLGPPAAGASADAPKRPDTAANTRCSCLRKARSELKDTKPTKTSVTYCPAACGSSLDSALGSLAAATGVTPVSQQPQHNAPCIGQACIEQWA